MSYIISYSDCKDRETTYKLVSYPFYNTCNDNVSKNHLYGTGHQLVKRSSDDKIQNVAKYYGFQSISISAHNLPINFPFKKIFESVLRIKMYGKCVSTPALVDKWLQVMENINPIEISIILDIGPGSDSLVNKRDQFMSILSKYTNLTYLVVFSPQRTPEKHAPFFDQLSF